MILVFVISASVCGAGVVDTLNSWKEREEKRSATGPSVKMAAGRFVRRREGCRGY
jgi:hypothetical protein